RHQAKRYDFATVDHPVAELANLTRILCPGPADDIAEIAHREAHPFGSVHHAGSGAAGSSAGVLCRTPVNAGCRGGARPSCPAGTGRAMTEPALGLTGAVLLVLAITALFLRPRWPTPAKPDRKSTR